MKFTDRLRENTQLDPALRGDLLEIIDDRYDQRSLIISAQLPVENWHDYIGDHTIADAMLDRIVHQAITLNLKGESLRKKPA
ncbi:ATP-binding protein [uncultured Paraglaciecola sp.]|uniref:ATP-binding protein n=1 Tax=uncultured Paraglaciecola sp. TaxID=1765024 RepID=UPI002620F2C2|nr:ATP-binding protein [uncultured Paraglaciecola sp.]